jgi:hypothetical protein
MSDQSSQQDPSESNHEDQEQGKPTHHYGQSDKYAQEGTLAEGYGQSEQMGEDAWSAEHYEQQAESVDEAILDQGEAQGSTGRSDIDRMVGGMIGTEEPSSEEKQQ